MLFSLIFFVFILFGLAVVLIALAFVLAFAPRVSVQKRHKAREAPATYSGRSGHSQDAATGPA